MRLYAYTFALDAILKEGYLSASRQENPGVLSVYKNYAKSENKEDIIQYLEQTFRGRFRSICCLTAPAPLEEYEHPYLDNLVKNASLLSFDLDELIKDNIVEAIYCKDCVNIASDDMEYEHIYKLKDVSQIDTSPLDWKKCDVKYGSPFNVIRHYMIVLKDGIIPPQYIRKE